MKINLPWILSRKRLIVSVVADGFLFAFLHHSLHDWRFGALPSLSPTLGVLLVIWCLSSYVIGRYVSGAERGPGSRAWEFIGRQLISTGAVTLLSLSLVLLYIWVFNPNPVQALLNSFLIPFLGVLALSSPIVQLIIYLLSVIQDKGKSLCWSYVGSELDFLQLQEMLKWSRLCVSIEHIKPEHLHKSYARCYIINNFHNQPSDALKFLLNQQSKGAVVLSRLAWCELVLQRFPPEFLSKNDLLAGCFSFTNGGFQARLKRAGDVMVALFLLVVTSPLILVSAFLIKCSDRGAVFYSQVRTGLNGKRFRIWKLRTMCTDAEEQGVQWSTRSDSRITKVGSILRVTRLDELPQLWCVLTGSMSLIGPRPERPEFDHQLSQKIQHYKLRYLIRPGLSGWAQVNYPYGASVQDSANKLSYDLFYLKNFSFLLDLLILFKTIRLVFRAQGALPNLSSKYCPLDWSKG